MAPSSIKAELQMIRTILLASLLCPVLGCDVRQPVALSATDATTVIEVTPDFTDSRPAWIVKDEAQVARFVHFVNSRQDGWFQPFGTFPSFHWTVAVSQGKTKIAVFWLSPDAIGGRESGLNSDSNRLRNLTHEEWSELQSIVGIAPEKSTRD